METYKLVLWIGDLGYLHKTNRIVTVKFCGKVCKM